MSVRSSVIATTGELPSLLTYWLMSQIKEKETVPDYLKTHFFVNSDQCSIKLTGVDYVSPQILMHNIIFSLINIKNCARMRANEKSPFHTKH